MVVEFLRAVRRHALLQLFGKAVGPTGPLEGQRGEGARHGVIDVPGKAAVGTEGDHHLRTKAANAEHQLADNLVQVSAIQFAVGVVSTSPWRMPRILQDAANSARRSLASSSLVLAVPRLRAAVPSVRQTTEVSTPRL